MDRRSLSRPRGSTMHPISRRCRGYSLIELLVVMAIVGILAIVGVVMIGDRRGGAVRSVLDELEGVVLAAQRNAMATGTDVTLQASGSWVAGTLTIDGRRTDPANPANRIGSTSEVFNTHYLQNQRDHTYAGIIATAADYDLARGGASALDTVSPGDAEPFLSALGNNLCTGAVKTVTINGTTKRFMNGFCIIVAGLRDGNVVAGGPVGVIVVPGNMASVFKFYKGQGETQWRRL